MSPSFIYFDLDDTLLDHKNAEQAALNDLHGHYRFFKDTSVAELVDTYHDINKELWEQYGRRQLDREMLQRKRFELTLNALELDGDRYGEVGDRYMSFYENHWGWMEGAEEVLINASRKYDVGILTNGFLEIQKNKINRFELDRYASHLVISEEVGTLKPQPGIFEHATQLAGVPASEIWYVGDSYRSDIVGGSEYGWNTVWLTDETDPDKTDRAALVIRSMDELDRIL